MRAFHIKSISAITHKINVVHVRRPIFRGTFRHIGQLAVQTFINSLIQSQNGGIELCRCPLGHLSCGSNCRRQSLIAFSYAFCHTNGSLQGSQCVLQLHLDLRNSHPIVFIICTGTKPHFQGFQTYRSCHLHSLEFIRRNSHRGITGKEKQFTGKLISSVLITSGGIGRNNILTYRYPGSSHLPQQIFIGYIAIFPIRRVMMDPKLDTNALTFRPQIIWVIYHITSCLVNGITHPSRRIVRTMRIAQTRRIVRLFSHFFPLGQRFSRGIDTKLARHWGISPRFVLRNRHGGHECRRKK